MQLGNILTTATNPVVCKPVKFKVLGRDPEGKQVQAQAEAVWAFVSEDDRQEAKRLALAGLRERPEYRRGDAIPVDVLTDEECYRILMVALRDKDDPSRQFCPNAEYAKFRSAILLDQVNWLLRSYREFVADEYPELVTVEQHEGLTEEARGN